MAVIGLLLFVLGIVGLIRPIPRLFITTRRHALFPLVAGFILMAAGTGGTSAPAQPSSSTPSQQATTAATASQPGSPASGTPAGAAPSQPATPSTAPVRQHVTGSIPGPGSCHYRKAADGAELPDPQCTPGATDPRVIQQDIAQTICQPGYTSEVRPPVEETDRAKRELMLAYGQTQPNELDHLIPLELGGSSDVKNLWPEQPPSPNPKDQVESELHALVCSGKVQLAVAQRLIATDWTTALAKAGAGGSSSAAASSPASGLSSSQQTSTTSATAPAGATAICNDGSFSFSQHAQGTCSRHGGVRTWLKHP